MEIRFFSVEFLTRDYDCPFLCPNLQDFVKLDYKRVIYIRNLGGFEDLGIDTDSHTRDLKMPEPVVI